MGGQRRKRSPPPAGLEQGRTQTEVGGSPAGLRVTAEIWEGDSDDGNGESGYSHSSDITIQKWG